MISGPSLPGAALRIPAGQAGSAGRVPGRRQADLVERAFDRGVGGAAAGLGGCDNGIEAEAQGAFLFASRAFDEHDRFVAAPGRRFAAVFLLGVVAFVIGLRFA